MHTFDETLAAQARAVLAANWTGSFTKPAPGLYPHQWSWDSAFIAIGYAHYDQARAEQELRALFEGQWAHGLLPQIVFNPAASGYFPGPEIWRIGDDPRAPRARPASGIVQPPVHASAALLVFRHARDGEQARAFLAEIYEKLCAWHAYLYRERDPQAEGLVYIRHPWESGMDNSPLWDAALERIPLLEQALAFERQDVLHVDAGDRPTDGDYQRYLALVDLFAERGYDEAAIREGCPFLIQDVLFNTLLCQSARDLAEIAEILGHDPAPHRAQAERTAQAIDRKLWNQAAGAYQNFDMVAQAWTDAHVAAQFTPLFAGIPSAERAALLYAQLNSPAFCALDEPYFPVPSNSRRAPDFSPQRYWRGPIWINVNWLIERGLRRYGFDAYADRLAQSIVGLARDHGFYEYFDPYSGQGHGTGQFSWTAALLLDVLAREGGA